MAVFKAFNPSDVQQARSYLYQLVDIINTDISASQTRRKYEVWVSGTSGNPGVTSSLFQTVYDQDFTLQTANPIFDITFGFHSTSNTITNANPTIDINGKYIFPASTIQMREKMDSYREHAQILLGDATAKFQTVTNAGVTTDITDAIFVDFKRLFKRDQIKRETFAFKMNTVHSGNMTTFNSNTPKIFTDVNSVLNKDYSFGGQVSTIVDSAATTTPHGLLFIDQGIMVLNISTSLDPQNTATTYLTGVLSSATSLTGLTAFTGSLQNLMISGSMDDVIDYLCQTRFSGSDDTTITFQNVTNINSTQYVARLAADEFNYSSNPTYTDSDNRIVVIDEGQEETQESFTFFTTIGMYDAAGNLLAVAKVSRPVLKDNQRDLSVKVRLDF